MKILILLILGIIFVSCSTEQRNVNEQKDISNMISSDFSDQLASMGADYLNYLEVKLVKIPIKNYEYLDKIFTRIVSNNEIFFGNSERPHFYFIQEEIPFFFSLPNSQFYFSTGLFQKYLKSEELFIAVLANEIIKSKRNIYEKKMSIPLGCNNLEKMIKLTRVSVNLRAQLNEWSYLVLKRSGYDASVILNWIQVQNRNVLDFSLLLGDTTSISKEEHLFKSFMAKEGVKTSERKTNEANSSKEFYQLVKNIVRRE